MQCGEHVAKLVIAGELQDHVARQFGLGPRAGRQADGADLLTESTSVSRALLCGSSERLILILHMAMSRASKSG